MHADVAGRLLHHLEEVEGLSLKAVQTCILDEADRLFELGLFEQVDSMSHHSEPFAGLKQ